MNEDAEFTDFVHASGTQLYRAALLLSGDHHLAEDLTQTTYAKVYARWSKVSRADNPVAYARTTLLNTFLSHKRLKRSSEVPVLPTTLVAEQVSTEGPDTSVRLDLLQALTTLNPTDRAVLVLRYWEDRSVAQTAQDLGMTETGVRTRARRALERIRPLLVITEGTP